MRIGSDARFNGWTNVLEWPEVAQGQVKSCQATPCAPLVRRACQSQLAFRPRCFCRGHEGHAQGESERAPLENGRVELESSRPVRRVLPLSLF